MHPVAAEVEEAEEVGVEGEEVVVVAEEEGVVEAEAVAAGSEPDGPTLVASSSKFAAWTSETLRQRRRQERTRREHQGSREAVA
jgi:hypothetical protein